MRGFLITVLAIGFGLYKGAQWFQSDSYTQFILKNKEKSWAASVVLKTARYHIFADDWPKATTFLDICLHKEFEKSPELPECMYERARAFDVANQMPKALEFYELFLKDHSAHPKAELVRKRIHLLKHGH